MKSLVHISKIIWISTFLLLTLCPVMGQGKKLKKVTPEDFKLWSNLNETKLSDNGQWASFKVSYESNQDTLFVKNTKNQKIVSIPKGFNAAFLGDFHLVYQIPENRFQLRNLEKETVISFENVAKFSVVINGILLEKLTIDKTFELQLINSKGEIIHTIPNVSYYTIDPTNTTVAYYVNDRKNNFFAVLDFKNLKSLHTMETSTNHSNPAIKWHTGGTSFLFADGIEIGNGISYDKIYFYKIKEKKVYTFDPKINRILPDTMNIDARYLDNLSIGTNEQFVYFTIKSNDKTASDKKKETVQIWNAADKELYPKRELSGRLLTNHRLVKWDIKNNSCTLIGDNDHPLTYGHVDQVSVLLYNENENKPYFTMEPTYTFWLFNTTTKKKSLFIKEQPGRGGRYNFSPKGNFFVYCKDLNWWLYSFETNKHFNLTQRYKGNFIDDKYHSGVSPSLYGIAGWSENDEFVYIYDEFDIWEFNTKTGQGKQLSFGRKNQEMYRLANQNILPQENIIDSESSLVKGKNFIVKVLKKNNTLSGFSYMDKQNKWHTIVKESKNITHIIKAKNSNIFLYTQEDFKTPPALYSSSNNSNKMVFQSNRQYSNYTWGESKLITYKNAQGKPLNAVLIFPANYHPETKYPMIVYIYQSLTSELHHYTNPSYLHGSTINYINFMNDDYFILLPDIEYELGNPGISATDCVVSAVKEVINSYPINDKKIGLTGHSFGGYETDFIITQTKLFAASASGAAITDFISSYLDYNSTLLRPQTWCYEHYQMRMKKSLFTDYEGYLNNSPVTHAANISTPLLSYSQTSDMQVAPTQSIEFYLALRRLQKKHILLMYPTQNHVFSSLYSQKDLNQKLKEWFDYYLKDKPKLNWMEAM